MPSGTPARAAARSHDLAVTMTKTSLGTPEANVTDCSDDSGAVAYSKSRQARPGEAPGRQAISAQVQPFDGTWKVTYLVVGKTGSCWPAAGRAG